MSEGDTNPWGPPGQDTPPATPGAPDPVPASAEPTPSPAEPTPSPGPAPRPAPDPTTPAEPASPADPAPLAEPAPRIEPVPPAELAPQAAGRHIPPYVPAHPPDVDPKPFENAAPMLSWAASEDEPPARPINHVDAATPGGPVPPNGSGGSGGSRFGGRGRLIGLAVLLLVIVVVAASTLLKGGSDQVEPTSRQAAIAPTQVEETSPEIAQPKEITAQTAEDQLNGGHVALKVTHKQLLRTRPAADGRLVRVVGSKTPYGGPNVLPIVKARGDWVAVVSPYRKQNNKVAWTKVQPGSKFVAVEYSISIRLSKHTIVVRKNGKIVHRFNTAIGRTGHATPTGRFAVTDGLIFKADDRAIYGCCALVLSARQPNLPAGWTGGDRIAMHGTPNKDSIGLAASLGCLRVGDEASRWLVRKVPAGATVFIKP